MEAQTSKAFHTTMQFHGSKCNSINTRILEQRSLERSSPSKVLPIKRVHGTQKEWISQISHKLGKTQQVYKYGTLQDDISHKTQNGYTQRNLVHLGGHPGRIPTRPPPPPIPKVRILYKWKILIFLHLYALWPILVSDNMD